MIGYLILDSEEKIVQANPAAATLLGWGQQSLIRKTFSTLVSRDAHDAFRLHRRNVAETGTTQACEIELLRGDGKKFLARLESLETNGTMRILFIDLTAYAVSQRVRQECEQRFRAIFEESGDAIWFKDRDLRLTQVNSRVARLFGRPAGELIGLRSDQVLGPELAKQVEQIERRVLSGEIIQHERTITVRGVTSVWNVILTPVRGRQNEIVGMCAIGRDITDSKGVDRLQSAQMHDSYPSDAMRTTLALARSAAKRDSTILLLGETGSGKDYLARYIHDHSIRAGGPFLSVNCAAIAHELAESELFGHEPGAFTGAQMRKRGLLELAEGGTILLNEVGELSPALQAKLLTFLDTRKVTRVGGEKETRVNVRIMAATHRNLEKEVEAGQFRQDLFFRLNVISISVPPLRERREDFPILVQEILSHLQIEMGFASPHKFESEALQKLANYAWPGNVRELRNVLERAVIHLDGKSIDCESLASIAGELNLDTEWSFVTRFPFRAKLSGVIDDLSGAVCMEALRLSQGNKTKAAQLLGITRDSLYRRLRKCGQKNGA